MTTATEPHRMSADEFLSTEHRGFELVDGLVVENPGCWMTSWIAGKTFVQVANYADEVRAGSAFPPGTGISVWPGGRTVRKPDVMFLRRERTPATGLTRGWCPLVPDLAIEVVSPNDLASTLERKLSDYRAVHLRTVWVIYPETRTVHVYRDGDRVELLDASTRLADEEILPGFSLDVGAVLDAAAQLAGPAEVSAEPA